MKGQFWTQRPRLKKSDIALTLVPIALWVAAIHAREPLIPPHCIKSPSTCTTESLPEIDRTSLNLEISGADAYSFTTQNAAGYLAIGTPVAWQAALMILGRATPTGAMIAAGIDLLVFSQTTAWNGFSTELLHLIVQRPRPFVYQNPAERGKEAAHYTSFPSGHTSFAAAACVGLFLCLLARGAPTWLLVACAIVGQWLISATALFRVLAGRHFVTDTWGAIAVGTLVAVIIAGFHKPRTMRADSGKD